MTTKTNPKRILAIRRALDQSDYHVTRWPPHKVGPGPSSVMRGYLEHDHAITATDAEIRIALALNPERDLQNMGDKVEDEILADIAMYFIEDEVIAKIVNVIDFIQGDYWNSAFQDAHLAMEAMREALPLVQELSEFCRLKSLEQDEKESK